MRVKTVANVLVAAGAVVGIATVAVIALDYSPSLTPEMVKLLFYKGLGAAAVGLIVVGTIMGRIGRDRERQTDSLDSLSVSKSAITESGNPQLLHDSHGADVERNSANHSEALGPRKH